MHHFAVIFFVIVASQMQNTVEGQDFYFFCCLMTQGTSIVRASSIDYDNLSRAVEFKGRASAIFAPRKSGG